MAKRFCFLEKENFILIAVAAAIAIAFYVDEWRRFTGSDGFQSGDFQLPPYSCGSGRDGDRFRIDDFRYFGETAKIRK